MAAEPQAASTPAARGVCVGIGAMYVKLAW